MKLDTGSEKDYLGWKDLCDLKCPADKLQYLQEAEYDGVGGAEHRVVATCEIDFFLKDDLNAKVTGYFHILDTTYEDDILIERPTINKYNLLTRRRLVPRKAFPTGPGRKASKFTHIPTTKTNVYSRHIDKQGLDNLDFDAPISVWDTLSSHAVALTDEDLDGCRQAARAGPSFISDWLYDRLIYYKIQLSAGEINYYTHLPMLDQANAS